MLSILLKRLNLGASTKDINLMEKGMVMVNFTIKMEECTKESGNRIRWKDLADCSINQVN